jgi:hypothetical protein
MSAAFDYLPLQGTAQELIDRFGRDATLTRDERPTTANPPAGKPWVSTLKGDSDLDAAPAQSIEVSAVFLSLDRRNRDGQVVEAKTQTVLIGGQEALPEQLGPDWRLVDGTRSWEVLSSKPLTPGPLPMLTKLELAL